jgi:phospholipid/cholesterol/gamma-HCH transport system substrate-binding protein
VERQANYALVGGLALALLAALMVFVVWLAGAQLDAEYDAYDVIFLGSVQGLSQGGDVYFNGIRVGDVSDLKLDQNDPNRVVARVRLDGDTPVKVDSLARLEPLGITGVLIIQISAGAPRGRLLKTTVRQGEVP